MDTMRDEYAVKLNDKILACCQLIENDNSEEAVKNTLGIDKEQNLGLIKRVVNGLPNSFFNVEDKQLQSKMQSDIVKEFILFQAQEDKPDNYYERYLENFIYELIGIISKKYDVI